MQCETTPVWIALGSLSSICVAESGQDLQVPGDPSVTVRPVYYDPDEPRWPRHDGVPVPGTRSAIR